MRFCPFPRGSDFVSLTETTRLYLMWLATRGVPVPRPWAAPFRHPDICTKDDCIMKRLSAWGLLALAGLFGSFLWAQDSKGISWKHGLSFQVRKAGENDFTDDTKKFGAEVFLDKDISQAVYITEPLEAGKPAGVGLGTSGKLGDGADVKASVLFHALEVRVRKAGETSFEKAGKISSEIFKDVNAENLVYISEKGSIAVMPAGDIKAPDKIKDPVWFHALEPRVRKAGDKEFDDKTKKIGLEVYKDENTNQLFYITEEGFIAITPAGSTSKPAKVENP